MNTKNYFENGCWRRYAWIVFIKYAIHGRRSKSVILKCHAIVKMNERGKLDIAHEPAAKIFIFGTTRETYAHSFC